MLKDKPALLILAAGLASRYGSLKQIEQIGPSGERIIDYSVFDAIRAGFAKVVFVIREEFEKEFDECIIKSLPSHINTDVAIQKNEIKHAPIQKLSDRKKPWGTGHAVLSAEKLIDTPFVVINADDFYGYYSFKQTVQFIYNYDNINEHALIGYPLLNTMSDFGSVSRGICEIDSNNYLKSIVERTKIKYVKDHIMFNENSCWKKLDKNEIVSMNMFAFKPSIFASLKESFKEFLEINGNDQNVEFYLPSAIDDLIKQKMEELEC